jgi:mRNA interferase RelE/StbE
VYRIEAARSRIKRELKGIPDVDRGRIAAVMAGLRDQPRPPDAVQLEPNVYRIRIGNYRVIYKVYDEEQLILIGRVARRSESTYKGIGSLFD